MHLNSLMGLDVPRAILLESHLPYALTFFYPWHALTFILSVLSHPNKSILTVSSRLCSLEKQPDEQTAKRTLAKTPIIVSLHPARAGIALPFRKRFPRYGKQQDEDRELFRLIAPFLLVGSLRVADPQPKSIEHGHAEEREETSTEKRTQA